jgi:hypothetical protein
MWCDGTCEPGLRQAQPPVSATGLFSLGASHTIHQIPKKRIFILTNETDYYRECAFVGGNDVPFAEFLTPQSAPICVIGRLA